MSFIFAVAAGSSSKIAGPLSASICKSSQLDCRFPVTTDTLEPDRSGTFTSNLVSVAESGVTLTGSLTPLNTTILLSGEAAKPSPVNTKVSPVLAESVRMLSPPKSTMADSKNTLFTGSRISDCSTWESRLSSFASSRPSLSSSASR